MENYTSLWGGNSKISSGNTSWNRCRIGYLLKTSASSTSLPLSLEMCTANKKHPFLRLCFAYIVFTIVTNVSFFLPCKTLCSPLSSRHSMDLSLQSTLVLWRYNQSVPKNILYDPSSNTFKCVAVGIPFKSNAQALTQWWTHFFVTIDNYTNQDFSCNSLLKPYLST